MQQKQNSMRKAPNHTKIIIFCYLHVPIDDVLVVQVAERHDDLTAIEPGARLGEDSVALQVVEQLAPIGKLHHEAETVGCLERVGQRLE